MFKIYHILNSWTVTKLWVFFLIYREFDTKFFIFKLIATVFLLFFLFSATLRSSNGVAPGRHSTRIIDSFHHELLSVFFICLLSWRYSRQAAKLVWDVCHTDKRSCRHTSRGALVRIFRCNRFHRYVHTYPTRCKSSRILPAMNVFFQFVRYTPMCITKKHRKETRKKKNCRIHSKFFYWATKIEQHFL